MQRTAKRCVAGETKSVDMIGSSSESASFDLKAVAGGSLEWTFREGVDGFLGCGRRRTPSGVSGNAERSRGVPSIIDDLLTCWTASTTRQRAEGGRCD